MNKDICIEIGNMLLNIRVGIIFKFNDKVLIEIRKDRLGNSVIPGGRLKINESRIEGLKREIQEEMNYKLEDDRIIYRDTIESFFKYEGMDVHELFFVYEYKMNEEIYKDLLKVKENKDNHITNYIFVSPNEFDEVDLLPLEVRSIIKE